MTVCGSITQIELRNQGEKKRGDKGNTSSKSIHIVQKVKSIGYGYDPEHAEKCVIGVGYEPIDLKTEKDKQRGGNDLSNEFSLRGNAIESVDLQEVTSGSKEINPELYKIAELFFG